MENFIKKPTIEQLLILAGIVSTIYLVSLGWFNNLLVDDYLFTVKVEKNGIIGFVSEMYNTWQGRFGSFLISGLFFILKDHLALVTVIELIAGYLGFYLFCKLFVQDVSNKTLWAISILFINISVMSIFEFSTFYWLCASTYIMLIFLTFFLIWAVFQKELHNYAAYAFIILFTALIGGGAETYTPLIILVFGCILMYKWYKHGFKLLFQDKISLRLLTSAALLSAFFVVLLVAPGNKVRMNYVVNELHFIHPTGVALIAKTFRAMINLFFLIASKSLYFLLVFPVFYWLAEKVNFRKTESDFITKINLKVTFIVSAVLLVIFLWISLLPGVYAINDLMPLRSLCYVSFSITLFMAFWGYMAGLKKIAHKYIRAILTVGLSVFILSTGFFIYSEVPKAKKYYNDIQLRNTQLRNLKNKNFSGIAYVKPVEIEKTLSGYSFLWNSVVGTYKSEKKIQHYYFPYEQFVITSHADDWRNQGYKNYLKLDFDIVCDSTSIIKN